MPSPGRRISHPFILLPTYSLHSHVICINLLDSHTIFLRHLDYSEEYTFTSTLSYGKKFAGKHDFYVMAGFEAKNANYSFLSATATDFPIDNPQSFLSYDRFLSFFARLTYNYDNRYLFSANFRRDGSPKFGPTHRWGNFPSFSAGWKISEEPFFKKWKQNWFSSLKPRVSWGILGNDTALASYSYLASFSNVTLHSFDGSSAVAGYNIYFIRLPDIYLMYAELLAAEGRDAEALEYVNKVHRRAYGYDPDQASPVDYASLQDRTKTVDPEDHLADNPLLYERWAELFGEMRWWEDVRRLRLGAEEAGYYKTVSGPGAAKTNIVWKETNYAMPIPTSEFESNPSSGMVQTPGY